MFWTIFLSILGGLLLLSVLLPVTRRMWAFTLTASKYFWLWVSDVLGLRKLAYIIGGKRAAYVKLTRPALLRMFCEDMGPTFIKFGQIIASSSGMFPDRYVQEFNKVLDRVKPFPFPEVQRMITSELGAERAAQLVNIEPKPLASASIAQVHTAELADGTKLVIKVQRPGISGRVMADMKIMRFMARIYAKLKKDAELANPVGIIEDFTSTLAEELDFRKEAANLERFNEIMRELGHQHIRAPVPQRGLTTQRVLVMERFSGVRVDRYDEIRARGFDGETTLVEGLRAWFQCVVFYGFFHGDVHAGNLMLLDDRDLGFLDFGIVGRFRRRPALPGDRLHDRVRVGQLQAARRDHLRDGRHAQEPRHGRVREGPRRHLPAAAHAVVRRGQLRRVPARHPAHGHAPPRQDAQGVHPHHQAAPVLRSVRQGAGPQAQRVHRSAAGARHDGRHPEGPDGPRGGAGQGVGPRPRGAWRSLALTGAQRSRRDST
jgi:hypothetical protein